MVPWGNITKGLPFYFNILSKNVQTLNIQTLLNFYELLWFEEIFSNSRLFFLIRHKHSRIMYYHF